MPKENDKENDRNNTVKIFTAKFSSEEIKENINISTNINSEQFMLDSEVSIHIDNNNNFNKIFIPFAKELYNTLREIGLNCKVVWGNRETNARKIILGSHSCPLYWLKNTTNNDIIVNFEPIYKDSWRNINSDYLKLLRRQCVFDYCAINLSYLEESYSFNTPPFYSELKPKREKEIDILFVGSINEYRINSLKKLKEEGININPKFNILGNNLYQAIDGAKIYLNLDLDKKSTFNEYRFMSCALTNTLFAGHSGNIKYYPNAEKLVGLSIFKNEKETIEGVKNLLSNNSYMQSAFTAQYKYAHENRKRFELFIRHHFY